MKYAAIITATFLVLFSNDLYANQENSDSLAEEFLVVTKQKEQNDHLVKMLKTQIPQQVRKHFQQEELSEMQKNMIQEYIDKMTNILVEEMAWKNVKADRLKIVTSIYSDNELKSLIKFFESDLGQLYINKQQVIIQKLGEASQRHTQNLMRRIKALDAEMGAKLGK